jgi:hypothetical protein
MTVLPVTAMFPGSTFSFRRLSRFSGVGGKWYFASRVVGCRWGQHYFCFERTPSKGKIVLSPLVAGKSDASPAPYDAQYSAISHQRICDQKDE